MVRVQVEKKRKNRKGGMVRSKRGRGFAESTGGSPWKTMWGVLRSQRRGGDFSANGGSPSESKGGLRRSQRGEVLESQRECFGNNGGSC